MEYLPNLLKTIKEQAQIHHHDVFNYAIPQAWNVYGFTAMRKLHTDEILVNPYSFYAYTLQHILENKDGDLKDNTCTQTDHREWLRSTSMYGLMVQTSSSWDHDRDEQIDMMNLYQLRDNGTFLKCIALLPLWKRMGIRSILLHQPLAKSNTHYDHTYSKKESVTHFQQIQESLKDPMIPTMSAKEQCAAFIEACHILGIRVILEYCPGKLARDNAYLCDHPEWFYWIDAEKETGYQPPVCHALPQNTIPHTYTLRDFYRSVEVQEHIAIFQKAPSIKKETSLVEIVKHHKVINAPYISDQINAGILADLDSTPLRFFGDLHEHVPEYIKKDVPYLTQDILRSDLHPAQKPMQDLWEMLCENVTWYQKELGIDGLYIAKTFLLPEALQIKLVETARLTRKDFVMIAEDGIVENSAHWLTKGYDAISGSSAYEEHDVNNNKFHDTVYRIKGNACPMFTASEFYDSSRIHALENGAQLALTLTVMNHFIPNGIPYIEGGWECFETQPLQLSEYGNDLSLQTLSEDDPRVHKQGFLDSYYFNYRHPKIRSLLDLMTKVTQLRDEYSDVIANSKACIPVWFDDPKDPGIGFTFIKEDRALMVVCSSNMRDHTHLHIHTENLFCELPFTRHMTHQIYSTNDPYVQEIALDDFQNIPLEFTPGEVKFIQFI